MKHQEKKDSLLLATKLTKKIHTTNVKEYNYYWRKKNW